PALDREIEAVCRKAMALKPEDRYFSALDFAKDVQRWLDYESVEAGRPSAVGRLTRRVRRSPKSFVGVSAFLVVFAALLAFFVHAQLTRPFEGAAIDLLNPHSLVRDVEREVETYLDLLLNARENHDIAALVLRIREREKAQRANDASAAYIIDDAEARSLLEDVRSQYDLEGIEGCALNLMSETGHRLARVEWPETVQGTQEDQSGAQLQAGFRFRSYFSGKPCDDRNRDIANAPLTQPTVSIPIRSTLDGHLKVVFSVPIERENKTIAVLAITKPLSTFVSLGTYDRVKSVRVSLVDVRNRICGSADDGATFLHHPQLTDESRKFKSSADVLEILRGHLTEFVIEGYQDPYDGTRGLAGFQPIRIDRIGSFGWWVIVQALPNE
ncbi:MAG: hypothetical protein AAF517_15080, partial [Planctomycetota bacterium]